MSYIIVGLAFAAVTALALYLAWVRPLKATLATQEAAHRGRTAAAVARRRYLEDRVDQLLRTVHGDALAETWPGRKPS